jgi:hypothetical protein
MSALRVKSCCGYGAGSVWEPRKGNVRHWKPIPEDWYGTADWEDQVHVIVNCKLYEK